MGNLFCFPDSFNHGLHGFLGWVDRPTLRVAGGASALQWNLFLFSCFPDSSQPVMGLGFPIFLTADYADFTNGECFPAFLLS